MADTQPPGTAPSSSTHAEQAEAPCPLPRITIRFCTQCKWMLRAAYFAQELLSTFSTSLGEVSLQPATGGIFVVEIVHRPLHAASAEETAAAEAAAAADPATVAVDTAPLRRPAAHLRTAVLWDRKVDGGFPETKELKRRVRDVIEPGRNLGHVDRDYGHSKQQTQPHHQQAHPLPPRPDEPPAVVGGAMAAAAPPEDTVPAAPASYNPLLPNRGGNMPVAPPPGSHAGKVPERVVEAKRQEAVEQQRKAECEDCQ